jgi:gliding motility-associated-like protein/uncharacterized repeat protein (TIGR01451 family)
MRSVNYQFKSRFTNITGLFFAVILFATRGVFAEGSKELNSNGGNRAYLVSGLTATNNFKFPTNGTMKVYVKAGEVINVGSSAQGLGAGTINLRSPNGGATYTSGTSTTVGLIANRGQEFAGPLPAVGGYTPYTHTVLTTEEGIWEIDFISENNGQVSTENNPTPISSASSWPAQQSGQYIIAFDVTVTSAGIPLTGRVYTNIFSGILGTFNVGFNAIFHILTNDGYKYDLNNNGQAGNGFSFFVNNKGFRKADGTASYLSVNSLGVLNIQDPRAADTQTDITHKIFFNPPATDMPTSAPTPSGNTWLLTTPVQPTLTGITFKGVEGTTGIMGTAPLGAVYSFTSSKTGTYTISIDVDKDGAYNNVKDVILKGPVVTGANTVAWNGLDGQNNKVPAGNYTSNLHVDLLSGEVHFPFFDVERNVNGIILTRLASPISPPDFLVYWDDTPITAIGTPSNPRQNTTGLNSIAGEHKWGTATTIANDEIDFGNDRGLDTWSYISANITDNLVNFQVREADLQVSDIVPQGVVGCVGAPVAYTFTVKNNGPNDVAGSKFSFAFPSNLTNVNVSSSVGSGTSTETGGATSTSAYTSTLNLANGAVRNYTVTGTVAPTPGGGTIVVTASILRTVDFTDPDATNPDAAAPADAQAECDSAPSGTGCNNVKTNTITFLALPDAGPDQSIYQDEEVTLTDANPGVWTEYASIPQTTIATPTALTTKVTGFKDIGIYKYIRTNASGCVDTVTVTVVPKSIDVPSVFTPNGDGKNDTFTIPGILAFPGSQLLILNRWGNEVYHSENYQNTWAGEGLTEGTYYYVINKKELSGKFTTFKGWVFLKRGR